MKERPILFSDAMVRAILEGRKTQTRRVVKPQPDAQPTRGWAGRKHYVHGDELKCPYGQPGDRLWVRECWARFNIDQESHDWVYRASTQPGDTLPQLVRWRPSIHMPRAASRILLEVTGVRVERLQDITKQDCRAEGVIVPVEISMREGFSQLWDSINAARGFGWDANPWVWVIEFKRT